MSFASMDRKVNGCTMDRIRIRVCNRSRAALFGSGLLEISVRFLTVSMTHIYKDLVDLTTNRHRNTPGKSLVIRYND